jgi:surfactin synthase thioesterase subunit
MNMPLDQAASIVPPRVAGSPSRPRSRWFLVPCRLDRPRLRLFCFPYAGAGASFYHAWGAWFGHHEIETWGVQYPGRENRIDERPSARFSSLIEALVAEFDQLRLDGPFGFFGHSLGAVVAHTLACELRRLDRPTPAHLFLSGRDAPHHRRDPSLIYTLPDPELIDAVVRYGNLPETYRDDRALMELLIPVLRADFALLHDNHRSCPPAEELPMLPCPFSIFGGEHDPWTTRRGLCDWAHYTTGRFRVRTYRGGHFFLNDDRGRLWDAIRDDLSAGRSPVT